MYITVKIIFLKTEREMRKPHTYKLVKLSFQKVISQEAAAGYV